MHSLVRPIVFLFCLGVAFTAADEAFAQGSPVAPLRDQSQPEILQQQIEQAQKSVQTLSRNSAMPAETLQSLGALDQQLSDARTRAMQIASGTDARSIATVRLLWLTGLFVVLSGVVLLVLSLLVRRDFWRKISDTTDVTWRTYLLQLPLGAPEGSVRALVSMYVIVFGLLVLVMQNQLGLTNVDAISGFIGIVITFYFTARSSDQSAKAVDQATKAANTAVAAATEATTQARTTVNETLSRTQEQVRSVVDATQRVASAQAPADPSAGAIAGKQSELQGVQSGLQSGLQVLDTLKNLGVGTGLIGNVEGVARAASGLVESIDPLLSGRPDLGKVGEVFDRAKNVLGKLDNAGLPGVLGDAIAGITGISGALGSLSPLLTGVAGGPVGLVSGIVLTGVKLLQDRQKFEAWKAALLRTPLNRSLMPPTVDGTAALAALDPAVAPLMAQRVGEISQAKATELMREMLRVDSSGDPLPASELAAELLKPGNPLGLDGKFKSEQELTEAIDQYRSGIVFADASAQLKGSLEIPAVGDQPARSVDMGGLLLNATKLSADPRAAGEIERLVYIVEALGKLGQGPERLVATAVGALAQGIALSKDREQTDARQ